MICGERAAMMTLWTTRPPHTIAPATALHFFVAMETRVGLGE